MKRKQRNVRSKGKKGASKKNSEDDIPTDVEQTENSKRHENNESDVDASIKESSNTSEDNNVSLVGRRVNRKDRNEEAQQKTDEGKRALVGIEDKEDSDVSVDKSPIKKKGSSSNESNEKSEKKDKAKKRKAARKDQVDEIVETNKKKLRFSKILNTLDDQCEENSSEGDEFVQSMRRHRTQSQPSQSNKKMVNESSDGKITTPVRKNKNLRTSRSGHRNDENMNTENAATSSDEESEELVPAEKILRGRRSRTSKNNKVEATKKGSDSSSDEENKNDLQVKVESSETEGSTNEEANSSKNGDNNANIKKKKNKKISKKTLKSNEDYEVLKIIDVYETDDKKRQFLVRWKGYSAKHDTWEPESNLQCADLIAKFLEKTSKSKESDSEDDAGSDTHYEVSRILDVHFKRDGKREFLVRWKGYSSKADSWEPEHHLNCSHLISQFEEKIKKAKETTVRETRIDRKATNRLQFARSKRNQSGVASYYEG